jgi:hypothetical protein
MKTLLDIIDISNEPNILQTINFDNMKAKIELVTIHGLPFPVRALVMHCEGFTVFRMKGKEVHRVVHVEPKKN